MNLKNSGDKKHSAKWIHYIRISLAIIFVDVSIKQLAQQNNIQTTNGVFDITYTTNTGSLWSLFSNVNSVNIIFIGLSFLALGFLYYYIKTENKHFTPVSIIAGGIIGNLIDRILYGYVIDWANFHFWPIFNIADAAIVIGVSMLLFLLIKEEIKKK